MTDQIYYKIQYPLKKAISNIKNIDKETIPPEDFTEEEMEKIDTLLNRWETEGENALRELINNLRGS